MSYACDSDRGFLAQFDNPGDDVRISVEGRTYALTLADRDAGSRLYRGRSDGDDLTFATERGRGYFKIENGKTYRNCRARD